MFQNNKVGIISTGAYVPGNVVANADLERIVKNYDPIKGKGSLDHWYRRRYGIIERRWSNPDELPSDMAAAAGKDALRSAGLEASDIDFLILNTAFGDYAQPTTATQVQKKLGMRSNSFALELNLPCAGPVFGMVTAAHFLLGGRYKKGLILGVDKMSELVDKEDFRMAGLFGEAAAGCILGIAESGGNILDFDLGSVGEEGSESEFALVIPGGKAANPASQMTVNERKHFLKMNGGLVESFIQENFVQSIQKLLDTHKLKPGDIKTLIPHQASRKLVQDNMESIGFQEHQIEFTIQDYGNTSSASVFLTLDQAWKKGFEPGDKIILAGMGGGLNWGALLYEFG